MQHEQPGAVVERRVRCARVLVHVGDQADRVADGRRRRRPAALQVRGDFRALSSMHRALWGLFRLQTDSCCCSSSKWWTEMQLP